MNIWASSDLHIDYQENWEWWQQLSAHDYQADGLILAGDISHDKEQLLRFFEGLLPKFKEVFFVLGNHDVWVEADEQQNSLEKFHALLEQLQQMGVHTQPWQNEEVLILPLWSWYDYTFGKPSKTIQRAWMDFRRCQWPMEVPELSTYFLNQNHLPKNNTLPIISFSHCMPRKDLMPPHRPKIVQALLPVLGSERLGEQIKTIGSQLHIYGHHHLNRSAQREGTWFLNNAFGYPHETQICRRKLVAVFQDGQIVTGIEQWPPVPN